MRMSLRSTMVLVLGLYSASLAAQPAAEHKKLDALVGTFRSEIEFKGTTPSKASGTETCEWFANLHVVCRSELTGPAGLYRSMRTVSWVPALKQYASYSIDSLGFAALVMGTNKGNTWTFTSEGQGWKMRYVVKTSGSGYTSLAEYAGADGKWVPTASGKATRTK